MPYTFKSLATADLLMLSGAGDALLRVIGKAPSERGIITVDQIPHAILAIEAAVAEAAGEERVRESDSRREPEPGRESGLAEESDRADESESNRVTLRQRAWPFLEMLRRAESAGEPVTWGT